jgi:hypothetical protein
VSQTKAQLLDGSVVSVAFSAGSAAAPSVYYSADTTTGIYFPGSGQLAISTNGTGRLFISNTSAILPSGSLLVGQNTNPSNYTFIANTGSGANNNAAQFTNNADASLSIRLTSGVSLVDASTGILAFGTSNTERMRLDASGRVGVGTSSPSSFNSAANQFVVGSGSGSQGVTIYTGNSAGNQGSIFFADGTTGGAEQAAGYLIYEQNVNYMAFGTLNTERMRLDSSGRLGIGTTSPAALLDVKVASDAKLLVQDGNSTGNVKFNAVNNAVSANVNLEISASNTQFFNGGTERARIDSSGRLLVGTSSARGLFFTGAVAAQTQIEGNSTAIASLSITRNDATADGNALILAKARSAAYAIVQYVNGTTSDDRIGRISFQGADGTNMVPAASIEAFVDGTPGANDMPGRLVFSTTADGASSPTERMRITNTGKTWLSSTDNVFGQLQIGNTTSDGECSIAFIPGVTAFGTAPTSTNGNSVIWVMGPNVFGGGGTQFAIGNKDVFSYVAKLASNTATSWTFSSDERLKNIEGPVVAATQIIEAINPVYYSFKADSAATRKVGLIAQNVLSVLPEVVDVPEEEQDAEGKQQYMGLAMTDLVPVLIAALKESNLKIKELTDRVASLEAA